MIRIDLAAGKVFVYVSQQEQAYPIPLDCLGEVSTWNVLQPYGSLVYRNVSRWGEHLITTRSISLEQLQELLEAIQGHVPYHRIDIPATLQAAKIYWEFVQQYPAAENVMGYNRPLENANERRIQLEAVASMFEAKYLS